jgi:hypothetical protein
MRVVTAPSPITSRKGVTAVSIAFNQPLNPASADKVGLCHVLAKVKTRQKTVHTGSLEVRTQPCGDLCSSSKNEFLPPAARPTPRF